MGLGGSCVLAALGGAVASVAGPNLRSVMLNVNEPDTRGVALALQVKPSTRGHGHVPERTWAPGAIACLALAAGCRTDGRDDRRRLMAAALADRFNEADGLPHTHCSRPKLSVCRTGRFASWPPSALSLRCCTPLPPQAMTDDLGKGLGPVLVAGLIHVLGRKVRCRP